MAEVRMELITAEIPSLQFYCDSKASLRRLRDIYLTP
jgi:hypothetical protein